MKKIFKIVLVVIVLAGIAGYFVWQKYKHGIVKDLIVNSVSNFTDSLYVLQYDSSMVDEVTGEAYFENLTLKTDSAKLQKLTLDDNLPDILINISVKSISASGLDIPSAMNENKLFAQKIVLNEPNITIIQTGKRVFKQEDSMALFKKILGNYNQIHVEQIEIVNANFITKTLQDTINTKLTKLNISLHKIIIDSTKDYKNVISYFINNMKANADQLYINQPNRKSAIVFNKMVYNAKEKVISIDKIVTIGEGKNEERFILNSVKLEDLNIIEFINANTIDVGNISMGECMLTVFLNKKDSNKTTVSKGKSFDFPDDYFDKIKIGGIEIGKSTLILKRRNEPNSKPIIVKGFTFNLSKNVRISERSTFRSILDNAKWNMQADDFTVESKDKKYRIVFNQLKIDKMASSALINSVKVKPVKSEEVMTAESKYQQDIYDIEMKDIQMKGLDINKFINESSLQIQELALNMSLKVYHDRAPNEDPTSKVGKYPHQLLLKIGMPINIQKAKIVNSFASYRERSKETKQVGNITFSHIEGIANNITNQSNLIQQNPICSFKGSGLLIGKAKCETEWRLFLNSTNGKFEINGSIGSVNYNEFNPLTKPLGLTTVDGQLNSLKFNMLGNDNEASGDLVMLYNDLKLQSFKLNKETQILESKKGKSMATNLFVKNNNPSNGNTRNARFSVKRDNQKSFFNLIWKGVYDGIQNTILNNKVAEIKKQIKANK